jgi:Glycosyltransferase 61
MHADIDPASAALAIERYRAIAQKAGTPAPAGLQFHKHKAAFTMRVGVADLRDAIVLAGEWFVLKGEHAICDAFQQTPYPPLSAYHAGLTPPNNINLLHPDPETLAAPTLFLLGGCPNYSHWLMDYLPRLALWDGAAALLMNDPLTRFQRDSLAMLGIGDDKIIGVRYPNAYRVPALLFPSLNSSWCMPPLRFHPGVIQWLRSKFIPASTPARGDRRIFISRAAGVAAQRLRNADEIEDLAKARGFEVIACETMPFSEQVATFSGAAAIAAPHGAGLANMVFAPANARILELIGPRCNNETAGSTTVYRALAGLMNLPFGRCVGEADSLPIENNHLVNESYRVSSAAFSQALDRLLQPAAQ